MVSESSVIQQIAALRERSPLQRNQVHEADAEIIEVDGQLLALTSDSLFEELERGLISDLYTAGWLSVLSSLSDLAAVGATPLGILLSLHLPRNVSKEAINQIYRGVEDCCRRHKTFVLGGDTNHTDTLSISTTALGKINGTRAVCRTPLVPDSPLFVSGTVGTGNLAAFLNVNNQCRDQALLQHEAQIQLGQLLLEFDAKAIDTSDGLLFTLNHLFNVNDVGFRLDPTRFPYHPLALKTMNQTQLPGEILALGEVGDYELLFTIPKERRVIFERKAKEQELVITRIGSTTRRKEIVLGSQVLDLRALKDQLDRTSNNEAYMEILAGEVGKWRNR